MIKPFLKKATIKPLHNLVNKLKKSKIFKWFVICCFAIITIAIAIYDVLLISPRSINFDFTSSKCISQLTILPKSLQINSSTYDYSFKGGWKINNFSLLTTQLCISPHITPKENIQSSDTIKLLGSFPIKKIFIKTSNYPSINISALNSPLATTKPINLESSINSSLFSYDIISKNNKATCSKKQANIICPLQNLNLIPGSISDLTIKRTFKEEVIETVFNGKIQTLDPVNIVDGNAINNNIIYDKPTNLELIFDKPLKKIEGLQLFLSNNTSQAPINTTTEIIADKLIIKTSEPLKRNVKYTLTLNQALSTKDNSLIAPYKSEFTVSGGPKVTWHNTSSYGFNPSGHIIIRLNQTININDKLLDKITISTPVSRISTKISLSANTVTINPISPLPSCTNITIHIDSTISNQYGVSGDSAWNRTFRTLCRRTAQIGTSTQGRAILAHWYGSGSSMVLFVGGIHGNEKSSTLTMDSWLDELERYAERIPVNRTIVVITSANPDGYAANSRFNSNGVDLNRNFPSANWSANVSGPGYMNKINGGGTTPLSEPETKALSDFVNKYKPRVVLSFHSAASIINPNGAGDSSAIARLYNSKTPYRYADAAQTDIALGYTTSGDFEFWLRDIGIPNVLIELSTLSRNEFSKNRDALWLMANL